MSSLKQKIKFYILPFYIFIRKIFLLSRKSKLIRKWQTNNYKSSKVAFGEKNCYGVPSNWITVDLSGADINLNLNNHTSFPFADNSQDLIYSTHMIEHLDSITLKYLLKESHRILKNNGGIRFEAPDFNKAIQAYKKKDKYFLNYFIQSNKTNLVDHLGMSDVYAEEHIAFIGIISCYIYNDYHVPVLADKAVVEKQLMELNSNDFAEWCISLQTPDQISSGGHINPLTGEKLVRLLKQAGFQNPQIVANQQTNLPNLDLKNGLERTSRAFYSFYVEAQK